jgi:4-hydroxy-tetrahydrodipicolinate synthase
MNPSKFKGTGVALVTPFHKDGSIDFKAFKKLIDRCIEGKVDYLVPLGTTGESVTLSADERRAVVDFTVEVSNGRVPVMMGLGGNNTLEIMRFMEQFDFNGIDAVLSVSPYYNRPSQRGIFQHYKMIGNNCPVPVMLYNVPSRTGSNMDAQTTLDLAHEVKNIIGIKEASGSLEKATHIIAQRPKNFLVVCGDDLLALPMICLGADGLISVIANAFPKDTSELVRTALEGVVERPRKLHYKLMESTNAIFSEGSPSGIKGLLSILNVTQEHVRLPLVPASKALMNRLEALVNG